MRDDVTLGIVGAGGDGVITLGRLLQQLAAEQGYYAIMNLDYGAQIRGGESMVKTTFNGRKFPFPEDRLDILLCFNWDKFLQFQDKLPFNKKILIFREGEIPFSEVSRKTTGSLLAKNIVAVGFLKEALGLTQDFKEPVGGILRNNFSAYQAGKKLFHDMNCSRVKLKPPRDLTPKIIIHGNEAVAEAALCAGCSFATGYPITPSTEIMELLAKELPASGGIFVQGASENESLGMLYGASLAGKKVLVATSGPGLDRMMEFVGLFSATEVPLVIVNVQRCGPATGIPTRTEQSDLNTAVYGGHGSAPRVVLAPFNIESCYTTTIQAFNIAERYQVPVIMLSDQWLGQTMISYDDFTSERHRVLTRSKPAFGDPGFIYQTTGLTHNGKGRPVSDQTGQQRFHEGIWKKLKPLKLRKDLVKIFGNPRARVGIISWGSSGQLVRKTVEEMGLFEDMKICIPELLFPFPEKLIANFLAGLEKLLIVEMSYNEQFYRLLRSYLDLPQQTKLYCRAGGEPFTFRELSRVISEAIRWKK